MAKGSIKLDKVVLLGGSAGSLDALLQILPNVRADISYPIAIILHRMQSDENMLGYLLSAKTKLQVKEVEDKDMMQPGCVYLAPGDYHLLFEKDGRLSLDFSEKVNYSRPSIDVSFQSAADAYGHKLTCIILSGANADGTEGLTHVKATGGTTIAQQPDTADVSFMPEQAISAGVADHILDPAGIVEYLNKL